MSNNHRGFSSFVTLLIVVVIIGAIGFWWTNKGEVSEVMLSSEWVQYPGNESLEDITFEYPSDWKVDRHGTNTSDEGTSAIRVWKGEEQIFFISSDKAAIMPGCDNVTALTFGNSETAMRIFASAKCLH